MNGTSSLLATVRTHLATRYQKELGQQLADGVEPSVTEPTWRLVKACDLRSLGTGASDAQAGVLLDAEIGLVLFMIPFAHGDDLQAQILGALSLQSSLMPLNPPIAPPDEYGTWQVALHWLVQESVRKEWENEIVRLRQRSGFSKELVLDAIFYPGGELEEALAEHGFPRLLLTARGVLSKATPAEIADWMSADQAVLRALDGFPDLFSEPEQQQKAQLILDQLGDFVLITQEARSNPLTAPKVLDSLEIRNLRNLQHIRLSFGLPPVSCRVIHGPNGTGKTSIFEALSLALSGSSSRYRAFLDREERDVPSSGRSRIYVEQYLASLGSKGLRPRVGLNGEEPTPPALLESPEDCNRLDHEFSGTFLAQETSQEFLRLSSDQLAVRVLAGYSEFAERLEGFVEQQVRKANEGRQSFLRSVGLSASITLFDTAQERIAEQILNQELPPLSPPIMEWLSQLERNPGLAGVAGEVATKWRQWGEPEARRSLAGKLASSNEPDAAYTLENWLSESNRLSRQTRELAKSFEEKLAPMRDHFEESLRDLASWGEWLERRSGKAPASTSPPAEIEALSRQMAELQKEQQRMMQEGHAAKQHMDHLDQVTAAIAKGLVSRQPNRCPTCNADYSAGGGIEKVVSELRATTAATRERLLQEYRALEEKIKSIRQAMESRGQAPCPLADERQAMIKEWLGWLRPSPGTTLEAQLSDPAQRSGLLALLKTLNSRLPLTEEVDSRESSTRIARVLRTRIDGARSIFSDPDHWKPVHAEFTRRVAGVLESVLPETLQRLWVELTLSLTSARWVLPGDLAFDLTTKRGEQRVSIRVQDRLARYILNQAETHLLGLGWFFTKYLTHGRFRCRFLVMDDPAQHLDQTSYRDLCRRWRALVRLHTIREIPLRLILFLQQEDRALDAARATRGMVDLLGWAPEQDRALRELELFAPGAVPATPQAWFQQAMPAA
jgi:energy-coupling factor transporter ATP-binding protein EcfA2